MAKEEEKGPWQTIAEGALKEIVFLPLIFGGIFWATWHGPAGIFGLPHPTYWQFVLSSLFLSEVVHLIRLGVKD